MSRFKRCNGHFVYLFHGKVQITPVMSVVGVAVVFHFVHLIISVSWIVHHHNDVVVKRTAHRFVVKLFRRIGLNGRNSFAFLVLESVFE